MKTTNRRIAKSLLLGAAVALALLALRGVPSASADASDLKVEKTCGPAVFRPNEWTAYQCLIHLTNTGDAPLPNITSDYISSSGVVPTYYFVLHEVDGKPMPIDPTGLSFGSDFTLQPGQSADVRLVALLKMDREGAYVGEWPAEVGGEVVPGSAALHYEAKANAEAPPAGLKITQLGYLKGDKRVVFETTITNESSTPATSLSVMEHYGSSARLVFSEFAPKVVPDANLVTWDLATFGKQSLAPGEAVTLLTMYEPEDECGSVQSGVLVEATVDGKQQLYGSSGGSVSVDCGQEDDVTPQPDGGVVGPGGRGGPIAFGQGGEGPGEATFDFIWAAAFLATAGGLALGGVALVARRRVRR